MGEAPQHRLDRCVVEPQGHETPLQVLRIAENRGVALQADPIGAKGIGRHAQQQHRRVLQALLNLRGDQIARLNQPFVKPHPQAGCTQLLRQLAHHRLVGAAVAEEDVVAIASWGGPGHGGRVGNRGVLASSLEVVRRNGLHSPASSCSNRTVNRLANSVIWFGGSRPSQDWLMTASESTFAPLRRRERQRRITALRQRLRDTLGQNDCSVWLFGSLARGDWDGFSDIDLLVVAANQDAAERVADQLIEALVGG